MRRECRERFHRYQLQSKSQVSDPGMHHGTCMTHVPWCMSGSLTRGGGENVPGIPDAWATRNFTYLARGPWFIYRIPHALASTYTHRCTYSLRWRHNGRESVSNHQPHYCSLNHLFRRRSKKTSKLRVTGLCAGNSPGTGEFPAQMARYAENVSIWWRRHGLLSITNEK